MSQIARPVSDVFNYGWTPSIVFSQIDEETPDADRQVTAEHVHGGTRVYAFSYAQSTHADDYNHWKYNTVETLPGGGQNIIYSNYAGQTMLAVSQSGNDQWFEFYKYDETTGHAIWQANSSAVSGYDQQYADLLNDTGNGHQYLKDNDGLIRIYDYDVASGSCDERDFVDWSRDGARQYPWS